MTLTIPLLCGSIAGKASPLGVKIHDAGYKHIKLDYKYISTETDNLKTIVESFKALNFKGFGISMPFKIDIISYLNTITDEVSTIGACNTVVNNDGKLTGYNTDWRGALSALDEIGCDTSNCNNATIIGDGGVARAIAYGLKQKGYKVYIASRNKGHRKKIVQDLALDGESSLEEQGKFNSCLIVNATPIIDLDIHPLIIENHINIKYLLDVVFQIKKTPLTILAEQKNIKVAYGWKMLLYQAIKQFELYTNKKAPKQIMEKILYDALG